MAFRTRLLTTLYCVSGVEEDIIFGSSESGLDVSLILSRPCPRVSVLAFMAAAYLNSGDRYLVGLFLLDSEALSQEVPLVPPRLKTALPRR